MKRTLYFKFLLAYLLFGIFGFVVVATFVYTMTYERFRRDKAETLYQVATQIANTYAADLYNSETSLEAVHSQVVALSKYMDGASVWIVNPSGRLVLDSSRVIEPGEEIMIQGFDPTVTGSTYYTTGNFWGWFKWDMLSVFAPITANFKVQAYVIIHYPIADIQNTANEFLNISYLMLIVLFLLSLIILIFFTELVYVPLRKITTATEQYAAGNMGYEFSVESEDEMGYLAASLSYMAGEIARQEDDQKKFIANVSHDFRSPLTSIRGYLVAMQDGTIPEEMHGKYLGIVINETDRLTKLTNELLTLNNLNTRGMLLDRTDFDINQVIRNVAESFGGTCLDKNIGIELVLTDEKMLVNADISKIQQVLYNLVDNAIKFSHKGGSVKIETTEKHSKVFVSVKDTGIGIPKEDQKLIFDRFYKSDLSRGKDKKGTGLGLAIVKEIVKAHEENINVISTEGVGTEFIFSLAKAKAMDEVDE
ncbi:HAMP domain-containing sensor histidine kinase [Butyrivibrio sp. INlla14]|uniref:HAMP domain-containing sensor histidine kinase n=1 Tax=Butyrivibrio sp. INlla14 TaxID=1520808 RepID=UPI0008773EC2|nr:HAMP domain-containing sensor histidine kinase [Butyrivibrio sp. INlla14]SCY71812.1 Signal transduction histidine kinase [Butyrivibrio sp. INlla14]